MAKSRGRRAHLTRSAIEALTPDLGADGRPKPTLVWDERQPGLALKISPKGAKSFYVVGRPAGLGKLVWIKLGPASGRYDVEDYRRAAADRLAEMRKGVDPNAARRERRERLTLQGFADRHFRDSEGRVKPMTLANYRAQFAQHIAPRFGRMALGAIRTPEVLRWHSDLARIRPVMANRCLALLKLLHNAAERGGLAPRHTNPCFGVRAVKERPRERFLSPEERARLDQALAQAEGEGVVVPVAAIRLLLLTGARRNEILTLRWDWIDLDRRMINLPDSKTGAKPIILSDAAIAVLQAIPRLADNPHVIFGRREGARLTDLEKPWRRIRAAAGLEDVRLHDLRHSFASDALMSGAPLAIVGKLLGHSDPKTTQRYAHIANDALHEAVELAARRITRVGSGG